MKKLFLLTHFLLSKATFCFLGINILIFFAVYFSLYLHEKSIEWKFLVLAIVTLFFWSFLQAGLYKLKILKKHLLFVLLPYIFSITEFINFSISSKLYFCSQVYFLIFFAGILIGFDILVRDRILANSFPRRNLWLNIYNGVSASFLLIPAIILINYISTGLPLSFSSVRAICQTEFKEAFYYFFLKNNGILCTVLLLFLISCLTYIILRITRNTSTKAVLPQKTVFYLSGSIFFVLIIFKCTLGFATHNSPYRLLTISLIDTPFSYFEEIADYNRQHEQHVEYVKTVLPNEGNKKGFDGVFALIMGESVNRNYMSCYDHPKDTTPFQKELRKKTNVFFFQDAYSCEVQTVKVIPAALTDVNQYSGNITTFAPNSISLIDLAKHYRYKTSWISNQIRFSSSSSLISALVSSADHSIFLSDLEGVHRDEDIIKFLPDSFSPREVFMIHLAGSHFPYGNNYPKGFMSDLDFSTYEMSLRYNDFVIEKIFNEMVDRNVDILIYLSDHSDGVSTGKGHDPRPEVFTHEMTEIPMWIYLSESYCKKHPDIAEKMKLAQTKVFTNDLLFNLFLDLMGIDNQFTPEELNVLSDEYKISEKNAMTLYGTLPLF